MKKVFVSLVLCLVVAGCTWEDVENNAEKVQGGAATTSEVAAVTSPFTGPYGPLVGTVAGAVGTIAGAVAAFARARQARNAAKAAVIAAEKVPGGGAALIEASSKTGVSTLITAAYEAASAAGLVKPK